MRTLLRDRRTRRQGIAGLVAQLTQAAAGLGVILVVQEAGGSLALAGAGAAAFVIGAGTARPIQGRLMDSMGPRPVLIASGVIHLAGVGAMVGYTQLDSATWIVIPLALPIGLGEPPVSQGMRIAWGRAASSAERTAAYSLVTLIQEIAVLLGPLILAAVVASASAAAGLLVVGGIAAGGAFVLAAMMAAPERPAGHPARQLALRSPGVRIALAVTVLFAVVLGATEVGIPALSDERGVPAVSGLLLAAISVGGILGAIAYGSPRWSAGPAATLVALLALLTLAIGALIGTPPFAAIWLPLVLAGVAINPVITAVALLVEDHSPSVAAEAFGWQSTALALGTAAGNALGGSLADAHGASGAFAAAAIAAGAATLLAAATRSRLATGQPASRGTRVPVMGSGEAAGNALSDSQRAILTAVCDAVVPSLPRDRDPQGLWARKASDLGVDLGAAQLISEIPDPQLRGGLLQLLDAIGGQGITRAPSQESREQILRNTALSDPRAAAGVASLIGMTLFLHYGAPDPRTAKNPSWETFHYPGPISTPPQVEKPLKVYEPRESQETLEADVCIVGSGSGGAVVAAVLASRGLDVVVLEAAGYYNESDFDQLELPAYQRMFWRGGPTPTADGNVSLVAGTTLGGGTTINWTNCLRTRPWVREQWAKEHGLEGVDGPAFDRHLDAVSARINATDRCSDLNGTQRRLREGAEALGWSFETIIRNTEPESYTPEMAGYLGFGDQSGSKRSADRTWLADAQEHGARLLTFTRATRVLTENGRAAGVEAAWQRPDGRGAQVIVRAPRVVVACGSLESPALLLRSGIGGPAVGHNLRLHPSSVVGGAYGTDQQAWWGPPQAGLCDEFADTGEGYGFLVETAQYAPGLVGSATPWISGADHKQRMEDFRFTGTFISLTRDRGSGRVSVDANGEALPTYAVTDPLDLENLSGGIEAQIRLHEAAGAHQIAPLAEGGPTWRRGDDLEAFVAAVKRIPFRAGGYKLFSAHQMGSCRMGEDPQTSVAGPWGELHDTKGVWIGDGSAFPTSSGTNPMVSIMALAHRTAEAIADEAGEAPVAAAAESAEAQPA